MLSGREDLNLRPPTPEAGALTELRYAPIYHLLLIYPSNEIGYRETNYSYR